MKPTLVDSCEHFDARKSECTKCGRSLPDVCLEFEEMKQKAEAYDRVERVPDAPSDLDHNDTSVVPEPVEQKETPRAKNPPRRR